MLGKLLKYEFKSTGRTFLLMYLVFFVVTVFNKVCLELSITNNPFWSTFQTLFMFAYGLFCAAIFVVTAILIVTRFYRNLMCDEGYLMFTLPVTINQHIIAKMVTAFLWCVISCIVFTISLLLLITGHGLGEFLQECFDLLGIAREYSGNRITMFMIIYSITMLAGVIQSILHVYASIAIGQLVNKHRVLTSIAAYFCIGFVIQNILSLFMLSDMYGQEFDFLTSTDVRVILTGSLDYLNNLGIFSLVSSVILGVGFFFLTSIILKKKLNLE